MIHPFGQPARPAVVNVIAAALLALVLPGWPVASATAEEPIRLAVPAPSGKFRVGTRAETATDKSREAGFESSGPRKLMIQLHYPRALRARPGGRKLPCPTADYAPKPIIDRLRDETVPGRQVAFRSGVCRGGPVAKGKFPVIVLSHAFAASRSLYTSLAGDLASRGFIVASIDHTFEAFAVRFPTGPVVEGVFGGPLDATERPPAELKDLEAIRADDASFVLTFVNKLSSRKSSPLWRHVNKEKSGILGHSLGGAAAFEAATEDPRFDASANLDGEVWNAELPAENLDTPHLLALSEGALRDSFAFTLACSYFDRLTGPRQALLFTGTRHYSFSDFQTLGSQVLAQYPEWPAGPAIPGLIGTADPSSTVSLERQTLAKFFQAYLGAKKQVTPKLTNGNRIENFTPPDCLRPVP